MPRPEKTAVVDAVREQLASAPAAVLTEYRGLTVTELADLRRELRTADTRYKVAKNTLVKLAVRDAGLSVPDDVLTGPTAVAFVGSDPVAAAKVLRRFSRAHPALVVKGGLLDGEFLDAEATMGLADLASREELLARLAGLFEAVVAQPARLALASLSKAARLFAALQTKRTEAGETHDEPASAATASAEPAADEPASGVAAGDEAATEEPTSDVTAGEEPAAEEEPAADGAAADEPATETQS